MTVITFTIHGEAAPAGSKRGFAFKRKNGSTGIAISDANPKSKSWQHAVRTAAMEAYQGPLLQGPIRLTVQFFRVRPKGHFGTGRNEMVLKPGAPAWPISPPDTSKLLRGLEDALTSAIWRDDAQVVEQTASKHYGERPCVVVLVEALQSAPGAKREER